jgi:hypothetical protein
MNIYFIVPFNKNGKHGIPESQSINDERSEERSER